MFTPACQPCGLLPPSRDELVTCCRLWDMCPPVQSWRRPPSFDFPALLANDRKLKADRGGAPRPRDSSLAPPLCAVWGLCRTAPLPAPAAVLAESVAADEALSRDTTGDPGGISTDAERLLLFPSEALPAVAGRLDGTVLTPSVAVDGRPSGIPRLLLLLEPGWLRLSDTRLPPCQLPCQLLPCVEAPDRSVSLPDRLPPMLEPDRPDRGAERPRLLDDVLLESNEPPGPSSTPSCVVKLTPSCWRRPTTTAAAAAVVGSTRSSVLVIVIAPYGGDILVLMGMLPATPSGVSWARRLLVIHSWWGNGRRYV